MLFLQYIFNASLELGYCFIAFRDLFIIAFKKSKRDNLDEPRNYLKSKFYRLMTLLETIGKALETILAKQITYLAEIYNFSSNTYMERR